MINIVYHSTSKSGREGEGTFTTRELAAQDICKNNYYRALIVEEQVSEAEFDDIFFAEVESQ